MNGVTQAAWPDLREQRVIYVDELELPIELQMSDGVTDVYLRVDLPDHSTVIIHTTKRRLLMALENAKG